VKKVLTALSCALIIAVTISAAEARPRHQRVVQVQPQEQSFIDSFKSRFKSGVSSGNSLVERARQYVGATARQVGVRSTLWCSAFLRKVTGASDVDDRAVSWERHQRITPQVGAVVTMGRRGGGHVGIVSGFTKSGDPIVISGNHGHRVAESV